MQTLQNIKRGETIKAPFKTPALVPTGGWGVLAGGPFSTLPPLGVGCVVRGANTCKGFFPGGRCARHIFSEDWGNCWKFGRVVCVICMSFHPHMMTGQDRHHRQGGVHGGQNPRYLWGTKTLWIEKGKTGGNRGNREQCGEAGKDGGNSGKLGKLEREKWGVTVPGGWRMDVSAFEPPNIILGGHHATQYTPVPDLQK